VTELELGDIDGPMQLRLYDRLVADVAEKFLTTEAPEQHRRFVALIRERGQVWRTEHHRRTSTLASLLEADDDLVEHDFREHTYRLPIDICRVPEG
jgi:hypothetical protein